MQCWKMKACWRHNTCRTIFSAYAHVQPKYEEVWSWCVSNKQMYLWRFWETNGKILIPSPSLSLCLCLFLCLSVGLTTKSISWMRKSSGKVEAHKNIDTRHSIWFGRCEYAKERPVRRCHVESLTYLCTKDKDYYPFSALIFWHTSCEPLKDFE